MPNAESTANGLERGPGGTAPRKISQTILYSDFTDNANTTGSFTMTPTLPEGAFGLATKVTVETGFTGDSSAIMTVGKTDGEDEFSDETSINIFTADVVGDSFEDPCEYLAADTTVYLKVTSGSLFANVSAGKIIVELFYISTVQE